MSYLNEFRLSTYDNNLKEWISSQDSKTITSSIYPWTKTAKAGAISCYPVGGTPLKPVVDFLFSETPPASGDKGPDNPSTITGVSSVNVGCIGKNLLLQATGTPSSYTIVRNDDGSLSISGSGAALFQVTDSGPGASGPYSSYRLNLNEPYTLSVEVVSGSINNASINLAQSSATQRVVSIPASGKASTTFTPSAVGYVDGRFACRMLTGSSSVATNAVLKIQLEEGDTATDFEAPMLPADANHALPLGDTYYGGSIDLATGLMTVTWVGERLTTVTAVNAEYADLIKFLGYTTYNNFGGDGGPSYQTNNKICNLFDTFFNNSTEGCNLVYGAGNKGFGIIISKSRLSYPSNPTTQDYVDAMNTWLQNNNCFLAYRLYTPYTVQLTPPQIRALAQPDKYTPRLNTVYTDASSVQVGYVKSPIREEQELTQAIVSQGGNI